MASKTQKTPPPAFPGPVSSSARARLARSDNALFPNNSSAQLVDISVPVPPRGYSHHTASDSTCSRNSNPFRTPKHTPHASDASSHIIFSPVSPLEEEQDRRLPTITIRPGTASQAANMSEPHKSVDLRQLDGKPYPGSSEEAEPKSRKVKVAQDMYAGDMPPGYDRQDYNGPLASKGAQPGPCHKCGGHKKDSSVAAPVVDVAERAPPAQRPAHNDCAKCGGKPRSTPPSSYPATVMAAVQPRSQAIPRPLPAIDSIAGPSSAAGGHRHKCNKCGRHKRPDSISTTGSSSQPQSPQQFGATIQHRSVPSIQTNGIPVDISIQPPTAITERAPTLPFSPASTIGERPLIQHEQRTKAKLSRGNSISSLFRSLSRRKKSEDQLPSQKLANSGEQSPKHIIDKISSAIRDGDNGYSALRPTDRVQRPASPFSFVDKPQEEHSFEMNDMRKSKQPEAPTPERRNSWDKADESTLFLDPDRPKFNRSQSTSTRLRTTYEQPVDETYLGVTPDQRPGVTRFKSLRSGVNRAANGLSRSASQISRSTSLRRLESVKKVPQFWYRDDMTIEGANGTEYVVNVY
ncbi:hypothetical protein H2198_001797 [Neophaeococcomyces mojaviensis]|uniref:Uncharacterized protein n=1 Tax=Neophaeococcomyces mojaviensis TaxID=3383035 RepID=A0ACC3AFS2_9EURO|nr:hypothetical protein H2198_001797 [Knufia sp. JES_112]